MPFFSTSPTDAVVPSRAATTKPPGRLRILAAIAADRLNPARLMPKGSIERMPRCVKQTIRAVEAKHSYRADWRTYDMELNYYFNNKACCLDTLEGLLNDRIGKLARAKKRKAKRAAKKKQSKWWG